MKKVISLLSIVLCAFGNFASAASNTYIDYQNYNHGYCPSCNCYPCACEATPGVYPPAPLPQAPCPPPAPSPCDPCAPVCGAECGISICAIGVAVVAIAAAAAIIIASGNGASTH